MWVCHAQSSNDGLYDSHPAASEHAVWSFSSAAKRGQGVQQNTACVRGTTWCAARFAGSAGVAAAPVCAAEATASEHRLRSYPARGVGFGEPAQLDTPLCQQEQQSLHVRMLPHLMHPGCTGRGVHGDPGEDGGLHRLKDGKMRVGRDARGVISSGLLRSFESASFLSGATQSCSNSHRSHLLPCRVVSMRMRRHASTR